MKQKSILYYLIVFILFISVSGSAAAQAAAAPQNDAPVDFLRLGEPGFSLRYTDTFGVTEEPYQFDNDHINRPMGVFVGSDNAVYIAELEGSRVIKFNAAGEYAMSFGEIGKSYHHEHFLHRPSGVVLDANDHVWVTMRSAIKEYAPDGSILQTFPQDAPWEEGDGNDRLRNPFQSIFSNDGSRLFTADTENNRIQIFAFNEDGVNGNEDDDQLYYVETIDGSTADIPDGGFMMPQGLAFDSSDRLYVSDFQNFRVLRCAYNTGESKWECENYFGVSGEMGDDLTHLSFAADVFVDSSDSVFIADGGNSRVLKCDLTGTCSLFAGGTNGSGNDELSFLTGLSGDTAGNLYVSDSNNMRVQVFNSSGVYQKTFGITGEPYTVDDERLNRPVGIAFDPDGSMLITEDKGYRLVKLDESGSQVWAVGEAGIFGSDNSHFGSPWGGMEGSPAVDAHHKVYVADSTNNRIQVFNADGSFNRSFGSYGQANNQFDYPTNIAISPVNGDIYIADSNNQRVQVYSSTLVFKATIGVTQEQGEDNQHFKNPRGIAIDQNENIFIADLENTRVQKCTLNLGEYTCQTFIGKVGEHGPSFGHAAPRSLAIDTENRLYVFDEWGTRLMVFDSEGRFLTSVGGNEGGPMTSQFSNPSSVAIGPDGRIAVADADNHRIQTFVIGTPKWQQVNLNGFGDQQTEGSSLAVFNGMLYAGAGRSSQDGAEVWRQTADQTWERVASNGFGDPHNARILSMTEFKGKLYAGTHNDAYDESVSFGGQIWRSDNGNADSWEKVVDAGFGSAANFAIQHLTVIGDYLYASTYNENSGTELWRSASGNSDNWESVFQGSAPEMKTIVEFNGQIFAGNGAGEIWNSPTGAVSSWASINLPEGWGTVLQPYDGYLYLALNYSAGEEEPPYTKLYRCQTCMDGNWEAVDSGFNAEGNSDGSFEIYRDELYLFVKNEVTGLQAWKLADGLTWQAVNAEGFGDSRNMFTSSADGTIVVNDHLYVGTVNFLNGTEVWRSDFNTFIYLPLVIR